MNTDTTHSETGEENHSLADFTINRLHEAIEIANKSADDQMFQKREAEAEVARLRVENSQLQKELTKSESARLEIEDINGWIDSEFQIANKRALKSEAEVARLRKLLNRAIKIAEIVGWTRQTTYLAEMKQELHKMKAEARIAPATEEPVIQNSRTTEPEWRIKEKGEIIEDDDQYNSFMAGWVSAPWVGKKIETAGRIRTRRPLPNHSESPKSSKQEEMPLEKELGYLTRESSRATDMHTHVLIVDCLRHLRDEIQKIKTETNYHHESYCRKCNEPK